MKMKINGQQGISQDIKTREGSLARQGATHKAHNFEKRQQPSSADKKEIGGNSK